MACETINNDKTIARGEGTLLAGRYRIVRQLGQGGMGSVWLAEDTQLDNKLFAIKMLPSILVASKRAYRQLKDEALVAMKLTHPNIVTLRDFNENDGNPFLVMDYIDGQTLDDYLAEHSPADATPADVAMPPRPCCKGEGALATTPGATGVSPVAHGLPEADVLRILRPIAAALDYAHAKGVVHRDVKPGNVMIAKEGTPYILDFGIAREIQETLTCVTGKLSSGTLLYMSPEQLHGASPKPAQDIYSFAAMAYECLKGEPPFVRGQIEFQIDNDRPEPLSGGPRSCAAAVMAGLAKKPEDRPATCVDVLLVRERPVVPKVEPLPSRSNLDTSAKGSNVTPPAPKPKPIPKEDWRYLPPEMRSSIGDNGQDGQKGSIASNAPPLGGTRLSQPPESQPGAGTPRPPQGGSRSRTTVKIILAAAALALAIAGGWWWANRKSTAPTGTTGVSPVATSAPTGTTGVSPKEGDVKAFILPGGVHMEMVYVAPGTFQMGSSSGGEDETPHRVRLTKGYWIGKYPVTQAQWSALLSSTGVSFDGGRPTACFSSGGKGSYIVSGMDTSDFPMESISWNDCKALVDALNKADREGRRWSLPTETQWEFAARGGNKSRGYTYSGGNDMDAVGWYYENSGMRRLSDSDWDPDKLDDKLIGNKCRPHSVKEKDMGNELGIVGMSGNVWEWCNDWYDSDYYSNSPTEDPQGPASGEYRVLRGGSWVNFARYCRSSHRIRLRPGYRFNFYGFRLCCSAGPRE